MSPHAPPWQVLIGSSAGDLSLLCPKHRRFVLNMAVTDDVRQSQMTLQLLWPIYSLCGTSVLIYIQWLKY